MVEAVSKRRSFVAQAAAVVSVVLSLGLVAYEIRQNTKAVVGQTVQAVADQQTALALFGAQDADLREAWVQALVDVDQLNQDQRGVLGWYYTAVMRHTENRFRQFELGMLPPEALSGLGTEGNLFRNPYFKTWWPTRRGQFPADFARYVDDVLLPLSSQP